MAPENLTEKIGLTVTETDYKTLLEIQRDSGHKPVVVARLLVEQACQFYRENGWFRFPVVIEPAEFSAVAERDEPAPKAGVSDAEKAEAARRAKNRRRRQRSGSGDATGGATS